jgi:cytochrome c556
MTRLLAASTLGALALALACQAIAADPAGPEVDVRAAMAEGVNPAALAIWDVGNNAADDEGGLDPARMDADAWGKLQDAARSLATHAHRLATAGAFRASGPDLVDGKVPEGLASREDIQARIDAGTGGFRSAAATMEEEANALASAARERNLETASQLVASFDQVCQACHTNYWNPAE